ncbi:MAG: alanyl-tRNA editing protein, partial [Gammaproteobacteria bacterium]|nr:alanyl-tRNA editing protein [Gammaproteobacteria bacterium]
MVPTTLLFEDDAYRRNCEAGILAVIDGAVVLDATVFYPQGGGQPGDSGQLVRVDGPIVDVVDTRRGEQGSILHVCGADQAGILREGDRVEARIDWDRRYRHMRMHTCLHLLGSLLPYGVTGGNITAERS